MEIWTSAPEKKNRDQELSKKKGALSRGKKTWGPRKNFVVGCSEALFIF